KNIQSEQGYQPAGISVLHSWNQRLNAHWHVHLLVPGEGPLLDDATWKRAQAPPQSKNSDGYYLVDADRLRKSYRSRAIRKLRRLRLQGKLNFGGKFAYLQSDENWDAFLRQLESTAWVAYIQPPPGPTSQASEVVNYLTRYLTGGPISDHRITAADAANVTFVAREGKQVGGQRQQIPITLSVEEFVRRWCLHIQPQQLTKTRYLGGWSNSCRAVYMARCRDRLRGLNPPSDAEPPEPLTSLVSCREHDPLVCCHCGSDRLILLQETGKPSWREIFDSQSERCPPWYAELKREGDRRFWDDLMGEGFNDWYLETVVECAKEPVSNSLPVQLYLPGISPRPDYHLKYF
ncbi:MAG: transposase, partial [Pirellulaceae bacterium]|nr:transposase [Pirellulaceae bacterium]